MRHRIILLAAGLALAACDPAGDRDTAQQPSPGETSPAETDRVVVAERAPQAPEPPPAPDNTGRNVRDAEGGTVTPEDQSNAEVDVEIARRIRDAITSNESMSMNARNSKVVVQNGAVTLRGPVDSEQEKLAIQSIAQQTPGVTHVDNQLEVDTDVDVDTEFENEYEEER